MFLFLFLGNRASTSYSKKKKNNPKENKRREEQGKYKAVELKKKDRELVLPQEVKNLVYFCTPLTPLTRTTVIHYKTQTEIQLSNFEFVSLDNIKTGECRKHMQDLFSLRLSYLPRQ